MPRPEAWFVWHELALNATGAWVRVRKAGSRAWVCDVHVTIGRNGKVKVGEIRAGVGTPSPGKPFGDDRWADREARGSGPVQAARRRAQERVVSRGKGRDVSYVFEW